MTGPEMSVPNAAPNAVHNGAHNADPNAAPNSATTATFSPATLCNAALIATLLYYLHLFLDDIREHGRIIVLNWSFLERSFNASTWKYLMTFWISCNVGVLSMNFGFRVWRVCRLSLGKHSPLLALWDWSCVSTVLLFHAVLVVVPAWAVYEVDLPASATCALCFEQVRLLMKSYSYLREQVRDTLTVQAANHSLVHLLYFMFAPTLVYRHSYERTARVRLSALLLHSLAFLLILFTMIVVAGRGALRPFCEEDAPLLDLFGLEGWLRFLYHFVLILFRTAPAGLVLVVGVAAALHEWHMVFAELLRFQDQDFTREWWNASSYDIFFRDWNLFVKAWLLKYVHKEFRVWGYKRRTSVMITVALSAFWHEYILAVSLGYCIPFCGIGYVLCAAFVFSDPFRLQKFKESGNLFVLFTLSCGVASYLSFYFMESTARIQCPQILDQPWDVFVPRSLTCYRPLYNCTFM